SVEGLLEVGFFDHNISSRCFRTVLDNKGKTGIYVVYSSDNEVGILGGAKIVSGIAGDRAGFYQFVKDRFYASLMKWILDFQFFGDLLGIEFFAEMGV